MTIDTHGSDKIDDDKPIGAPNAPIEDVCELGSDFKKYVFNIVKHISQNITSQLRQIPNLISEIVENRFENETLYKKPDLGNPVNYYDRAAKRFGR